MFQTITLKENGVSVSKTRQILLGGGEGGEKEKRGSERELEMGEALIKVERVVSL